MDKTLELAKELKKELIKTSEYQNFICYKDLYERNLDVQQLRKIIVRCHNENRKEDYDKALAAYQKNPIVVNYESSKQELEQLLMMIKNIIQ